MFLNGCLQEKHFLPQKLRPCLRREKERDRAGFHCLPAGHSIVVPLWGDMHSSPPNTASRLFCLLHTGLRWGLTPGGSAVRLSCCHFVRLSSVLSCLCLQALSGPWIWQAHCQDGHHEAGAHLPPQSICGGVGCAGACTHVSSHVRPEDNVRHLLPSLSKLSFETRLSLNPELLNCLGCCVLCGFVLKPDWGDEGIKEGQIHRHVCRKAGV